MTLSADKKTILIDIVSKSFDMLVTEQRGLLAVAPNEETRKIIHETLGKKMVSCLKFKEVASVLDVDEELIDDMETADFNLVIGCLATEVRKLDKQDRLIADIEGSAALSATIKEKIETLNSIQHDLQAMFSYA